MGAEWSQARLETVPWLVSLPDGLVVEAGECVDYQTISASLSSQPIGGYYPGELTIETGGQIVVKAGGSLSIGKFAIYGPESSPVLRGTLREDGLIRVEAGGRLTLNGVTLEMEGHGLAIVQEDGGMVDIYDTDLTGIVQWGAPVVDNTYKQLKDIWLETGTLLTEDLLPTENRVWLTEAGVERLVMLPIRWTFPKETADDEITLTGVYLDANGEVLLSAAPLTLTVHWYTPETIMITDTAWFGSKISSVRLYVNLLPEDAEIWPEYSEDEGASWTRLDTYDIDAAELCCIIVPPDSTPRLYRLAAENWDGTRHWVSDSVLLPESDTESEDQGGNRGGSTTPAPPDREPTPPEDSADANAPDDSTPAPDDDPAFEYRRPDPVPAPIPVVGASYDPQSPAQNAAPEDAVPAESALALAERTGGQRQAAPETGTSHTECPAEPTETDGPSPEIQTQAGASTESPALSDWLSSAMQCALGVGGFAGCAFAGIMIARILSKKK